jgi:hypothetical protein
MKLILGADDVVISTEAVPVACGEDTAEPKLHRIEVCAILVQIDPSSAFGIDPCIDAEVPETQHDITLRKVQIAGVVVGFEEPIVDLLPLAFAEQIIDHGFGHTSVTAELAKVLSEYVGNGLACGEDLFGFGSRHGIAHP